MNPIEKLELLRQLAFIENPATRVRMLLKHDLAMEAEAEVRELIERGGFVYFLDHSSVKSSTMIVKTVEKEAPKVCVGFITITGRMSECCSFDPAGLKQEMGWSDERYTLFTIDMFRRAIEVDPSDTWLSSWEITATAEAMEQFIPPEHELRQAAECWCLRGLFWTNRLCSRYFSSEMFERYLGVKIKPVEADPSDDSFLEDCLRNEQNIVEATIRQMRKLGMNEEEIRRDFLGWLERYVVFNQITTAGWANASIFQPGNAERGMVMVGRIDSAMRNIFNGGQNDSHPTIVTRLIDGGMLDTTDGRELARKLYRQHASKELSKGHVGLVSHVTTMIGHRIFETKMSQSGKEDLQFALSECAAEAFGLAWDAGKYGIAAALVQEFEEDACINPELISERKAQVGVVFSLAEITGQPIRLDHTSVFTRR